MSRYFKFFVLVLMVGLIAGCGSREKSSILGGSTTTAVVSGGGQAVSSDTSSEIAQTIAGMFTGMSTASSSTTSAKYSAPSLVGTLMPGLGEADNTDGHYTVTAGPASKKGPQGSGKMWFLTEFGADQTDKTKVLYMTVPGINGLTVYDSKDITSTATAIVYNQGTPPVNKWLPSMWRVFSTNQPQDAGWLQITASVLSDPGGALKGFFNNWADNGGPKGIHVQFDAEDPFGNTMHQEESMEMRMGPPTDANPAHILSTGYMITPRGKMQTTMDAYIGTSWPVSGTMTMTAYTGHVATMTFNADGTVDGVVVDPNGKRMGIVRMNSKTGTGTFTDANGDHNINQ